MRKMPGRVPSRIHRVRLRDLLAEIGCCRAGRRAGERSGSVEYVHSRSAERPGNREIRFYKAAPERRCPDSEAGKISID